MGPSGPPRLRATNAAGSAGDEIAHLNYVSSNESRWGHQIGAFTETNRQDMHAYARRIYALLPKLLSGQLRIKDAERIAGEVA